MKFILLVITPERESTEALHWTLHKAKETGRRVRIVYLAGNSYQESAKKKLNEVEKQCRTFQVPFEAALDDGPYFEKVEKLANKNDVDILVITEKKKPFFKRWFQNSEAGRIQNFISCEIRIY